MSETIAEPMTGIEISNIEDAARFASIAQEAETKIILLPNNIEFTESEQPVYASSLPTLVKLAKQQNLPIDVHGDTSSAAFLEQRSIEWFAPAMFISALFASQNSHAVSVSLGILANYLTMLFTGRNDATASMDIYVHRDKTGSITKIKYKGPVAGIANIKDAIDKILNG